MTKTDLKVKAEKSFNDFCIQVNLSVGKEIMVLFGPSGAGKTQTLNMIAGLTTPNNGEITFNNTTFYRNGMEGPKVNIPARNRGVGYVFQDYALFPHLSALQNVSFPLHGDDNAKTKAITLLKKMNLSHVADLYPKELSGGQQQRISIARALASKPNILLLDEPFSALDISVKEYLQKELKELQLELGIVVIYVTHNIEDLFAIGDRISVMHDGQIQQVGPVSEVFLNPANETVLNVLGIQNVFTCKVIDISSDRVLMNWDGIKLEAPPFNTKIGNSVRIYIYPQDVKIVYPDRPLTRAVKYNQVTGNVVSRKSMAGDNTIRMQLSNGHDLHVKYHNHSYIPITVSLGDKLTVSLRKDGLINLGSDNVAKTYT